MRPLRAPALPAVALILAAGATVAAADPAVRITLDGHTAGVGAIAFSADGKTLASAGYDGVVNLWDVATGRRLATLKGAEKELFAVAVSPDGKTVAAGGTDAVVRLWDVKTEKVRASLARHPVSVYELAFAADGKTLVSAGGDVRVWDAATGEEQARIVGPESFHCVALSKGADHVATVDLRTVQTWDLKTGKSTATFARRPGAIVRFGISPDGGTVAWGDAQKLVHVWHPKDDAPPLTLAGHTGFVCRVVFSPDGKTMISGDIEGTIQLWDAATAVKLAVLKGPAKQTQHFAAAPDGKSLAVVFGKAVRVWDVTPYTRPRP